MMHLEGAATIGDSTHANSVDVSLNLAQGRCLISENSANTTGRFLGLSLATKDKVFLETFASELEVVSFLPKN